MQRSDFEDDLADICVRVGKKIFRCHQVVLASRSEYLKARLSRTMDFLEERDDLPDSSLPCLEEHDLSSGAFEKMIEYVYTDGLKDVEPDQAEEMFDAASRYLLFPLKRAVADTSLPHLEMVSPAELCHWLVLSDIMNMAGLPNDLILEIISNLPLKVLFQCKCLNTNFNLLISDPVFQYKHALRSSRSIDYLLHYSKYHGRLIRKINLQFPDSNNAQVTLGRLPSFPSPLILSSSGGLLLLNFNHNSLAVFNPVTGAYRFTPALESACIGLAYQLTDPSAYKLVAVCEQFVEHERFYTFKIFDSDVSSWRMSPTTCSANQIPFVEGYQAVYLDDSLHWLKEDGEVLAFDVKKELAKIIIKPADVKNNRPSNADYSGTWFGVDTWLGISQDMLAMAIACSSRIFIYVYDSVHGQWTRDKTFENSIPYKHRNGFPVFYDGKCLIELAGDLNREIYKYDVAANSWRKIGLMPEWSDASQTFRPFCRTLAKIPDCNYLQERRAEKSEIFKILSGLQKYLS